MKIPQKVIKFLDKNKVKYEIIHHKVVYTAYDKAATLRVKPNIIGKTLVLKIDKGMAVVLIPGNKNLDKNKFRKIAKAMPSGRQAKKIDFISEKVIKNKFKGIKIGAIPPFGKLWGLPTFMDRSLINQKKIIISGGVYNSSIKIKGADLKKAIQDLIIGNFGKVKF